MRIFMKKISNLTIIIMIIITNKIIFAKVDTHNIIANIGGDLNVVNLQPNFGTDAYKNALELEFIGGGFNIEVGYLHLSSGKLIHGIDTRASFGMNFDPIYKQGGQKVDLSNNTSESFDTIYFQLGATYSLGTELKNGKILVDILGLNLGYTSPRCEVVLLMQNTQITAVTKFGDGFLLGINLPLGTQYIFNNGLSIGFRHRLDFIIGSKPIIDGKNLLSGSLLGTDKSQLNNLAYNLTFSIGYVFGI